MIDDYGFGSKKFFCGYHGWSYSQNGKLNKNSLNSQKNRQLKSHNMMGNLGIITSKVGQTALAELSKFFPLDYLENKPLYYDSIAHKSNWKLLVENVLESYHLNSVHKETFVREGYKSNKNYQLEIYEQFALSKQLSDKSSINSENSFYDHAFVYPNLSISNTNDLIYFVSMLIPQNEDETTMHWFLFGAPKFFELKKAEQKVFLYNSKKFTKKALLEDKEAVERCYLGYKNSEHKYQLVEGEDRIISFQKWLEGKKKIK